MRQTARLYCLSNPYMPGLVKIGFTRRSVHQRIAELSFGVKGASATGVPGAFVLVKDWPIDHDAAHEIEQKVHHALRAHRVKAHGGRRAREFFHLEPQDAVAKVQRALAVAEPVSIPTWPRAGARRAEIPPKPVLPDPVSGWPPRPAPPPRRNASLGPWLLLAFVLTVTYLLWPSHDPAPAQGPAATFR